MMTTVMKMIRTSMKTEILSRMKMSCLTGVNDDLALDDEEYHEAFLVIARRETS